MLSDSLNGNPSLRINVKHFLNEVLEFVAWLLRKEAPKLLRLFPKHFVEVDCWKRVLAHDHHERYNAEAENVGGAPIVSHASLDFGSHVNLRPALVGELIGLTGDRVIDISPKSEVGKL